MAQMTLRTPRINVSRLGTVVGLCLAMAAGLYGCSSKRSCRDGNGRTKMAKTGSAQMAATTAGAMMASCRRPLPCASLMEGSETSRGACRWLEGEGFVIVDRTWNS